MKTKAFLLPLAFVVFVSAIACQVESSGGSIQCFTTDARSISSSSYELLGSARFSGDDSYSGDAFFYYSKDDGGKSELIEKGKRISAGKVSSSNPDFKATLSSLEYGTTYYYVATVQVLGEEYMGAIKSFTTEDKPTLSCGTGDASDITEISATIYGYSTLPRTELGAATVGFIYSMSTEPTLSNGKSKSSKEFLSDTQFVATITGLSPGTKYYYRSYILQNGNYLYGSVSSFTTASINAKVTTNSAQNISEHGATISGSLYLTNIAKLTTSVALYYSDKYTSREDIKANGIKASVTPTSDGNFSKDLTNLSHSASFAYFAYANIEGVEFFGDVVQFRTSDINASLQTGDAKDITEHKATITGSFELISTTSSSPTVYFYYSDKVSSKDDLKSSGKRLSISSIPSSGQFFYSLSNLKHSTTYYYVAYTKVEDVEFFGEVRSFNTLTINASINTGTASNLSEHKATLSGSFKNNTIEEIPSTVALFYSSTINDKAGLVKSGKRISISSFDSNGSFTSSISALSHSTKYYYVAYAKLEDVEFYGDVKSFSTVPISASVNTGSVKDIKYHSATLEGNTVINTIESIPATKGFYFSATATSKTAMKNSGTKVESTSSTDSFSANMTGDSEHRRYYYMAYLQIEGVEFLGEIKSFNMKEIPDGSIDLGLSVLWATKNVGASSPEGQGGKYHWGALTENDPSVCTRYSKDESLRPEDDVAHVKLGSSWRTPRKEDFLELKDNCTITGSSLNGITGITIRSNVSGFQGKSIFLPYYRTTFSTYSQYAVYYSGSLEPPGKAGQAVFVLLFNAQGAQVSFQYWGISSEDGYGGLRVKASEYGLIRPVHE